ncbi:hypothetical protein FPOA_00122 [Fusarium poae]|uniref:MACPF-like domain-containing protein n=1 Tax=Fusarium poae TaxID=36050 RepID=A0A1B8B0B6_FUSPO|nr:hypothetical protein FPOA_00122 [Fusarium poae]
MGLVTIGQVVHKIYQKEGEGVTRQERVLWWRVVGVARRWIEAHIPRFRVDDSSYVNVIETQNGLQASMAKSSFSQSSIEASAGGGFWGVSAAAKGGVATRKGEDKITTNSEEQKQMHVIYSFPRVTVYLDADSLELTDEVKRDIAEVKRLKTKDSVKMFGDKYGHIFSRRVKLGGRLISSHQSTATTADKKAESENSLKAAAAVSVSGYGFSASAEASHETGGRSNTSDTQQDFASNMAWEATGGNTVLCNNPPEWCGTVGNFRNWRIVEQSDIIPLTKFISTFDGYESLEHDFHEIAGTYKLPIGADVYYKVQLIDVETNNRLIAGPKDGVNPLKKAIIKVGGRLGHEPKIQKLLHDALEDSKARSVKFQDKDSEQDTGSFWVLERTFPAGDVPELRCDIGYFITNEAMSDDRKHLGLLHPTSTSDPDFLYPSTEANRGYFLLKRPKGDQRKGPIESGDTVVLEVWNADKTRTMGYVMRGKINKNDKPTANDINQVLSVAPKTHDATDNSDRIVEFRVEIDHFWHRPRP